MPTTLPGSQATDNVPPLPNTVPDTVRPIVPASWDDIRLISSAVFEELALRGKPAADALMAWIQARRAAGRQPSQPTAAP